MKTTSASQNFRKSVQACHSEPIEKSLPLPKGWKLVRLDEVCEIIQGQSPPGDTYNTTADGLPFFQGKAEFGDLYPIAVKWCTKPKKIAQRDDVLISVRAPVGPTNLCPSKACIGRGLAALRPLEEIPPKYILYAIRTTVDDLVAKATGSTFGAINGKDLKAHQISLAPIPVQRKIVDEIEKQFARLEAGIAALKRVAANLKRYRASVLKIACEGLWPRTTVTKVATDIHYGSSAKTSEDIDGVPVLRMGNIVDGRLSLEKLKFLPRSHREFPDLLLKPGDLLFNRTNSAELVGKTAVYSGVPIICSFASYLIRVRLGADYEPNFLSYYLNSIYGKQWIASVVSQQVGQANVNSSKLKALEIPIPPIAEQRRIVEEVERRLSVVDELDAVVSTNQARAEGLAQSILQRAFAGQLARET